MASMILGDEFQAKVEKHYTKNFLGGDATRPYPLLSLVTASRDIKLLATRGDKWSSLTL